MKNINMIIYTFVEHIRNENNYERSKKRISMKNILKLIQIIKLISSSNMR